MLERTVRFASVRGSRGGEASGASPERVQGNFRGGVVGGLWLHGACSGSGRQLARLAIRQRNADRDAAWDSRFASSWCSDSNRGSGFEATARSERRRTAASEGAEPHARLL